MTVAYQDDWLTLHHGDAVAVLTELAPESVNCVITSPPYWGLRDYGVEGQIGLEASPEAYVDALVAVFRQVRRVLRRDGVVWLNLGDTYASGAGKVGHRGQHLPHQSGKSAPRIAAMGPMTQPNRLPLAGLKPKDRVMIPARVALALQADGWWLRDEIVWAKPNPMPSSVTDRTTPSHEMVYLLTRSARYHYDSAAIRERALGPDDERNRFGDRLDVGFPGQPDRRRNGARQKVPGGWDVTAGEGGHGSIHRGGRTAATYSTDKQAAAAAATPPGAASSRTMSGFNARWDAAEAARADGQRRMLAHTLEARAAGADHDDPFGNGRDKRSVWTVATEPYPEAHFATFPRKLIEPMVLAGCPRGGVVLDPFGGSGTVAVVAESLGRRAILVELNEGYIGQALERVAQGRRQGTGAPLDIPLPAPSGSLWAEDEAVPA